MRGGENMGLETFFGSNLGPKIHNPPVPTTGRIKKTHLDVNWETIAGSEEHVSYQRWIINQTQQAREGIINFSVLKPQISCLALSH